MTEKERKLPHYSEVQPGYTQVITTKKGRKITFQRTDKEKGFGVWKILKNEKA